MFKSEIYRCQADSFQLGGQIERQKLEEGLNSIKLEARHTWLLAGFANGKCQSWTASEAAEQRRLREEIEAFASWERLI